MLLLSFDSGAEDVRTFSDLARLKSRQPGLVVAPHAFFPASVCLGSGVPPGSVRRRGTQRDVHALGGFQSPRGVLGGPLRQTCRWQL